MQKETKLAIKWDKELRALPKSVWFNIQQASIRGTPDRLGVLCGRFVALEYKIGKNARRAKLQEYNLGLIKKAGGYAEFVYPENWHKVYRDLVLISEGKL